MGNKTKRIIDVEELARTIFALATFPRQKPGYTIELKGEITYEKSTRDATCYQFTAKLFSGTIFKGVRIMQEYAHFSEIYGYPHDENEKHDESKEIYDRLASIANKIKLFPGKSEFYIPRIARGKTLETILEKNEDTLIISPFQ